MQTYLDQGGRLFAPYIPSLLGALAILVIGWVIALVISSLVRKSIHRTNVGPRLSRLIYGEGAPKTGEAEKWAAKSVFYLIMLFVLVAFFQALGLTIASNPLGVFLT